MKSPLEKVKVIDFSHVMAGPFCTHTLQQLGAEVIKVERVGKGDVMRHYDPRDEFKDKAPPFIAVNTGKKSITLDLKNPRAIQIAKKLISDADVVVENFRAGVMDRLGLGYEACKETNPGLIYCSISGFGQSGPLKDNPAYDHIVQAISGVMSLTGEPGSKPMKVGFPVLDTFAGYTAAMAILSALLQKQEAGKGQYIDIAMLDSSLNLMISMVAPYLIAGDVPKKVGNRGFNNSATSDTFKAKDNDISIGANTQKQYESLCKALEREDLIDDPLFNAHENRIQNKEKLRHEIESMTMQKNALEWEEILNAVDVPSAVIRSIPDICEHEHLRTRDLFISIGDKENPNGFTLRPGFKLDADENNAVNPAPALGEHTMEILQSLDYSTQEITEFLEEKVVA